MKLTLEGGEPESTTLEWELPKMTDGPNGTFVFFDEDGKERLLLEAADLIQIKQQINQEMAE